MGRGTIGTGRSECGAGEGRRARDGDIGGARATGGPGANGGARASGDASANGGARATSGASASGDARGWDFAWGGEPRPEELAAGGGALCGGGAAKLSGEGDGAPFGGGAPRLPGGGEEALRGGSAAERPGGDTGASLGNDAPGARGGGVAVGGGGAPPAVREAVAGQGDNAPGSDPGGSCPGDGAPGSGPGGRGRAAGGSRPKRTLGALALGLCAVGLAVGSGADFSAQTANPSNVFSAGSLSMHNSKDGSAILNAAGMKPGAAPRTGIVDIENTGSISGRFTLSRDQLTNTDANNDNPIQFAAKVVVGVVDCGKFTTTGGPYGPVDITPTCGDQDDHTITLGPLSIQNSPIDLGTYEPGEKHRYDFEASLDSSAGNEFSGDGSSARYVFDAKQTP